jgi:hypothetical protein
MMLVFMPIWLMAQAVALPQQGGGSRDAAGPSVPVRTLGRPRSDQVAGDVGSRFPLRYTFIEVEYPQIVAASVGLWAVLKPMEKRDVGLVGDIDLGISGAELAIGLGARSSGASPVEHAGSFGLQGVALRTWPWWSPVLPTSATFVGAQAFGHFFAFRCSVGVLWNLSKNDGTASPLPIGGCGIGLP